MFGKVGKSLRSNMLVGVLVATPVVATVLIVEFLFTFITGHLVPRHWLQSSLGPVYRIVALVIVVSVLYLLGVLVRSMLGRGLFRVGDYLLARIPVINTLYVSIRQVSESLASSGSSTFKRAVAVEYPRRGVYAIGFVTSELPNGLIEGATPEGGSKLLDVFIPTSPNPTSGFMLIVPASEVFPLKLKVADAMKMVMSAGAVLPGEGNAAAPTLLDRLEEWFKRESEQDKAKL
jgi:uncharacterized membrane protein